MKLASIILLLSSAYIIGADYVPKNYSADNFNKPVKTFDESKVVNAKSNITAMYSDIVKLETISNNMWKQMDEIDRSYRLNDPDRESKSFQRNEIAQKRYKVGQESGGIYKSLNDLVEQYELQEWFIALKERVREQQNPTKIAEWRRKEKEALERAKKIEQEKIEAVEKRKRLEEKREKTTVTNTTLSLPILNKPTKWGRHK